MCWVIGEGRRAFRVRRSGISGERLGWLDMGHGNRLVKTDKKGMQQVKTVGEDELRRMNV